MPDRPYTDADLRAEAARQLSAHAPGSSPEGAYAAMLDARIESTQTPDGRGPTWTEAVDTPDLGAPAAAIHAYIQGAADVSEWAINLGADGLMPSASEITLDAGEQALARVHFAFSPVMPEEMRTNLVEGFEQALADADASLDEPDPQDDGDADSNVFELISEIASRLRDATDSGEYHAVGLIYDLANGRTTIADARAELAEITFRHV
ncbi:hypothetical protein [Streptomyces spectabilis]|uniref:Uncharacterized protein n=1 Tax=Streptomyces spectabilis TaxID=68270 RepID=A0A5P2X4I6_STRST|nr:hypothetical protein [Streptomyces spectabilis]MBB5108366.1 hypothetical protein [Streptomyces spectabilis]MCI3901123.1 hypothetical protein [Streptomyces spectabilis]QEV58614.1 hypothetical protein CP982_07685 [Streptomyces spectabilis]GGV46108.1 hypothetical protein GCM10010245_72290 [Streptomyces spectabilis]